MSTQWASSSGESSSGGMGITYDSNTGGSRWQFKEIVFPALPPSPTPSFPQISFTPAVVRIDPEALLKDEAFVKKLGTALLKMLGKEQTAELIGEAPTVKPGRRIVRE